MFLKLALRNIFRNKRRTVITELAIVIGVVAIVFLGSLLNGMSRSWGDALIDSTSGHLTLIRSDYLEQLKTHPLKLTFRDIDSIYAALENVSGIEGSLAQIDIGGMIGTGEESTTFFGAGIDLTRQQVALPKAFADVVEGKGLTPDDPLGAVIGTGLAKSLKKGVGDTLLLATNTIDGQLNAIEIAVRGLVKTGEDQIDDNLVVIPLTAAQDLLAIPNRASAINIRLKSDADVDKIKQELATLIKGIEPMAVVKTWIEMNKMFSQVNNMFNGIAFIVGLILFIIVAAGVANTMLMSVFERTREIGTVAAIGTEPGQITWMFVLEAFCIGALGIAIGLLIGVTLTLITAKTGIHLKFPGSAEAYLVRPILTAKILFGATAIVMLMSLVASVFPARFASRLDPVEALRRN